MMILLEPHSRWTSSVRRQYLDGQTQIQRLTAWTRRWAQYADVNGKQALRDGWADAFDNILKLCSQSRLTGETHGSHAYYSVHCEDACSMHL